ncbi:MAG TPA: NAD(P)/FAD-dependent oxidoreductase [Pseudomonadales bacterium]|nr:NAD(P)/FAD-dependent oxidoreductase [Pseudomonadales bacterium]
MATHELETDYLIAGSGAVGMAFADVLVDETDADMIIVDAHARPGGHWNDAYPFVTLHQPSAFYGVSSRALGQDRVDRDGLNAGLGELATGAEVSAYFEDVMRHHLLPSGRVRYFPMCTFDGTDRFRSKLGGDEFRVSVRKRVVDATWLKTSVPSTHTPSFSIDAGVRFMPLNDLPTVTTAPAGYVVVGGGKTAIDACLWLLANGVDADAITWIVPRDGWLIPRENTQPRAEHFFATMGAQAAQMEAAAAATSIADLFARLEAAGVLVRLDPDVTPKMFHAATISRPELEALRAIRNVVRMGRVTHLGADEIRLEEGRIPTSLAHVHVDCSARAIPAGAPKTVFDGRLITPQTVRAYQPAFSAAFIAHVEAAYDDDALRNELCGVVPLPNHDVDWLPLTVANMMNMGRWSQDKDLQAWLAGNRLNGFTQLAKLATPDDAEKQAVMQRLRGAIMPAMGNLMKLMAAEAG